MFKNHLTLSLRTLRRRKGYTTINVVGLATSMACCLLILLFVRDELSYDRFHENADRIVRIFTDVDFSGNVVATMAPAPLGPALVDEVPGVEAAVRLHAEERLVVEAGTERHYEDGFYYADPSLFSVFAFRLVRGNPEAALEQPLSVVLNETKARTYFGDANPIGKVIRINGTTDFEVTGVLEDVPRQSHVQPTFLASFSTLVAQNAEVETNWSPGEAHTYTLLRPGYTVAQLERDVQAVLDRHLPEYWKAVPRIEQLTSIYLHTSLAQGTELSGDPRYLYIFSVIGLLILLVACVNYTNLATAHVLQRTREIGVRKAVGASRMQLVRQFLSEAVVLSLLSLVVAAVLVELFLPGFNALLGKNLALDFFDPVVLLLFVGVALGVGLLAGGYPALFFASFHPTAVLKGTFQPGSMQAVLRKGLVVFQFAVSMALLVGTFVIQKQLDYVQNKRLGLNGEQVVVLEPPEPMKGQYPSVKDELLKIAGVEHVTTAPLPDFGFHMSVWPERGEDAKPMHMSTFRVDPDFLKTTEIVLAAGRDFSEDLTADIQDAVLINEAAVKTFGWGTPEEAVGRTLERLDDTFTRVPSTVVGVVKDFHNESLREEIDPILIQLTARHVGKVLVRLQSEQIQPTLAAIEETWEAFTPAYPFEYTFLDDEFARFYRAERRLGQLFMAFATLAVLIACLGLLGLAAFMAERRTKEIGIRKVLGASVPNIVVLLSKDFVRLVLIALVVATPVAYVAMERWLADFAYRVDLGVGVFALAGGLALAIALLTVSYQAIRAALADPVKSLRYE